MGLEWLGTPHVTPLTEDRRRWDSAGLDGTPRRGRRAGSEASRRPEELR